MTATPERVLLVMLCALSASCAETAHAPGEADGTPAPSTADASAGARDGGVDGAALDDGMIAMDAGSAEPPLGAELPQGAIIPVRFVALARGALKYANTASLQANPGCPLVEGEQGEVVLTECIARGAVDHMNDALEGLTGQRLFAFESYAVEAESPLSSLTYTRTTGSLNEPAIEAYRQPGSLAVLITDELIGAGGFAQLDQRVTEASGGLIVVTAGGVLDFGDFEVPNEKNWEMTVLHELGHVWGAPHVLEEAGETLDLCGGIEVPWPPEDECACEPNVMEAVEPYYAGTGCPPCDLSVLRFDTPTYAEMMRDVAGCWIRQNVKAAND